MVAKKLVHSVYTVGGKIDTIPIPWLSRLEGKWSVDFAKGKNGLWYLIDMALAENSYHMTH